MKNIFLDISNFGNRELRGLESLLRCFNSRNKTKFLSEPKEIGYNTTSCLFYITDDHGNCAIECEDGYLRKLRT